jgi:hypothetical protein
MNPKKINQFFDTLSNQTSQKATVILTGAAAGSLLGRVRPSMDIDFAIELAKKGAASWKDLDEAVKRTVQATGVQANFAEDIDRWCQISLLDYKRHSLAYRTFGTLRVRLMDPAYWSIGKMTRYLDFDLRDMIGVFKRQKIPPEKLARLWGKALKKSPRSLVLSQFRKQVEHFFSAHGKKVWGKKFDARRTLTHFYEQAGI